MYTRNTVHKMKQLFGSGRHRVLGLLNPIFLERSFKDMLQNYTFSWNNKISSNNKIDKCSSMPVECLFVGRDRHFTWSSVPREGLAVREAKAIPSFSVTVRPWVLVRPHQTRALPPGWNTSWYMWKADGDVPLDRVAFDCNGVAHFRIFGVRQFSIFTVSKRTRMFVL